MQINSDLFAVHALPAAAAKLTASLDVAVASVNGKADRNIRFLSAQHTALARVILCLKIMHTNAVCMILSCRITFSL